MYYGANGSDFRPRKGGQKNESESVKEVENGSDCERLRCEGVPSKKMLQSKAKGCAKADSNENGSGYPASVNESVSVRPNLSESGVVELENESVTD